MRIVPSCALGSLAPTEGEPILYTWRWYHSATGMGLWAVLILAIVGPRANRTPKALLILIPLAVVSLGWFLFRRQMGGDSSDHIVFGVMVRALAVGSASLWLLAHRFAARTWYKTLLVATAIALGVALTGGLSLGIGSGETVVALAFICVMMVATVLGYALAVRGYRTRRAWRFLAWQATGTIALCFAGVSIMALILLLILGGPDNIGEVLVAVTAAGLTVGVAAFLIALPFTILGLCSSFFRQRLIRCLGEPSPADPAEAAS